MCGTENYKKLYISETINNSALPYETSNFNTEKVSVIKDSITKNLIQSMAMYGKKTGIDFKMPELTLMDWDKILHNVCLISFMQGLPLGTSVYNNYVIVPSTENKQFVDETNIFYVGYGSGADGCYHRLGCEHLKGDKIVGYNKNEFSVQEIVDSSGNAMGRYYYPHKQMACYYCIVNATNPQIDDIIKKKEKGDSLSTIEETKLTAYYNALAREKNNLTKLSDYVNGSDTQ